MLASFGIPHGFAPTKLPPTFVALPTADMAAVVELLADIDIAIGGGSGDGGLDRSTPTVAEAAHRVRRAARLLEDWPVRLLGELIAEQGRVEVRSRVGPLLDQFTGRVGRLLSRPVTTRSGKPLAFITEVVETALRSSAGYETRQRATTSRSRRHARVEPPSTATPISQADAMGRLEGRRDGRLARWWVDAGLLAEIRPTPDRACLSTEEVAMLVASIRFLADDQPRPDSVNLAWVDRSLTCRTDYDKSAFLLDLLDGRIGAWTFDNAADGLAALRFSRRDIDRLAALATLDVWSRTGAHVSMSRFRALATAVWDEAALPTTSEARSLAAEGVLRGSSYDPPGSGRPQRRWHAGDLIAEVQRRTRTHHVNTRSDRKRSRS